MAGRAQPIRTSLNPTGRAEITDEEWVSLGAIDNDVDCTACASRRPSSRPKTTRLTPARRRWRTADQFGDQPIASIRQGDVQALISELGQVPRAEHHSHRPPARRCHVREGHRRQADRHQPCRRCPAPASRMPAIVPPTAEQVQQLLDAAEPWYRVAIVIGTGIGLRSRCAVGLTVDLVDFLRRTTRWTGSGSGRHRRDPVDSRRRRRGPATG